MKLVVISIQQCQNITLYTKLIFSSIKGRFSYFNATDDIPILVDINSSCKVAKLRGIIILCEAIEKLKREALSKLYGKEKYQNIISLHNFALELLNKSETHCKIYCKKCKEDSKILQKDFISSSRKCCKTRGLSVLGGFVKPFKFTEKFNSL